MRGGVDLEVKFRKAGKSEGGDTAGNRDGRESLQCLKGFWRACYKQQMFLKKEADNYNLAQGISQIMFSYSLGASCGHEPQRPRREALKQGVER
jgi:hypothetical protein